MGKRTRGRSHEPCGFKVMGRKPVNANDKKHIRSSVQEWLLEQVGATIAPDVKECAVLDDKLLRGGALERALAARRDADKIGTKVPQIEQNRAD